MNAITKHEGSALALSESELIEVLQSSLYPGAALASVKMVLGYCKAAGLDPMQKPVHIVPMWDGKAKQMRDVVMPGVNLYRTQASRSGQFAGMTEPEFGPMVTETIGGQQISYPEWCRITVKRALPSGIVAEFTAVEYWMENYAMKGGQERSTAPNAMWTKRPRGQISKCAQAQALRVAFPEIASAPTADEMEGKTIDPDDGAAEVTLRDECVAKAHAAQTESELRAVSRECVALLNRARDKEGYTLFVSAVKARGAAIKAMAATEVAEPVDVVKQINDAFVAEMNAAEESGDA